MYKFVVGQRVKIKDSCLEEGVITNIEGEHYRVYVTTNKYTYSSNHFTKKDLIPIYSTHQILQEILE